MDSSVLVQTLSDHLFSPTSDDARRFLLQDGQRYCDILNSMTGWPVANLRRSVTVAAGTCMTAHSSARCNDKANASYWIPSWRRLGHQSGLLPTATILSGREIWISYVAEVHPAYHRRLPIQSRKKASRRRLPEPAHLIAPVSRPNSSLSIGTGSRFCLRAARQGWQRRLT